MKYRKLGKSGFEISEVGYGGWCIGGDWWKDSCDQDAFDSINLALDLGVCPAEDPESPPGDPLWRLLGAGPRTIDELVIASGLPLAGVLAKVARWELAGRLVRGPGGRLRRSASRGGSQPL